MTGTVYIVDVGPIEDHYVSSVHSSLGGAQATIEGDWQQVAEDEWEHTTELASIYSRELDYDPIAHARERARCVQAEADRLTAQARNRAWDDALLGIGYDQSGYPYVRRFGQ